MMYLSRWLRRSNASTGAEWLATRFGTVGKSVGNSHKVVVAFALLSCFGFLAYGFVGLGKFVEIFIPWDVVKDYVPFEVSAQYVPHFYGVIFTLFATFYSILGGMHSIVLGDMIKYGIMIVASFSVGVIAYQHLNGQRLNVPQEWYTPFFGAKLNMDWKGIIDEVNVKIKDDGYSLFAIFFMMMSFKGLFAALAGPAPTYDMQKILSTRSAEEASKMSGFVSIVLLPVRYTLIIGLTILALLYYNQMNLKGLNGVVDFERILPVVINQFLPVGLLGLVLTGLLGAFMGTFSGTLNAAQAYIVNDIYLKYINPEASNKKVMTMNYLVGVFVVVIGIMLGFFARDVNSVLQWIVSALYGGYVASNVLKWHWWRFNANGFFWGMLCGIIAALVFTRFFSGIEFLYYFPVLFLISMAGSIIGSYAAPATDTEVLKSFYRNVRPWGFWKPVNDLVMADDPDFQRNRNFKLNMFNVVIGIIAQLCLTILPMYIILMQKIPALIATLILAVVIIILKKTWWNKLNEY